MGEPGGAAGTVLDDNLAIACAEGSILPRLVQRAGRGAMTTAELLKIELTRLHKALDKSLEGLTPEQLHQVPAGHAGGAS